MGHFFKTLIGASYGAPYVLHRFLRCAAGMLVPDLCSGIAGLVALIVACVRHVSGIFDLSIFNGSEIFPVIVLSIGNSCVTSRCHLPWDYRLDFSRDIACRC